MVKLGNAAKATLAQRMTQKRWSPRTCLASPRMISTTTVAKQGHKSVGCSSLTPYSGARILPEMFPELRERPVQFAMNEREPVVDRKARVHANEHEVKVVVRTHHCFVHMSVR